MAETGASSGKKKKAAVVSPTKSVKFNKVKTPKSEKKKFVKTPHSSKTPVATSAALPANKKRKLSFSNAESSEPDTPPKVSPKKLKKKTAKANAVTAVEVAATVVKKKEPKALTGKKRKAEPDSVEQPEKKKKVISEAQKLKEKQENTVFVGNLPTTITKEGIIKAFSKFGKVRSARIRCIPLKPEAKNRKAGALLKQFAGGAAAAFVKFSNEDDAKKSLVLNGTMLNENRIRVDMADPSKKRTTSKNKAVFLRNLHLDLTDDELWKAFEDCGEIDSVRIIKDRKTYRGRGLGYVNFQTSDAVELALKKEGSEIKGRPVKVHRCDYLSPNAEKRAAKQKLQSKEENLKKKKKNKLEAGKKKEGEDFTGKKSQPKKKVKKKLSATGLKKKKIAQALAVKS